MVRCSLCGQLFLSHFKKSSSFIVIAPQTKISQKVKMPKRPANNRNRSLSQRVCCYILTIPRNRESAQVTALHLEQCGLPKPIIYENTPVKNPTHINQIHRNIFEGHLAQLMQFYQNQLRENRHLHYLGFEDDARVIDPQTIVAKIHDLLDHLEQNRRKWTMVNLGCAPLGPAFPTSHGLAIVSAGYSVHSLLVNGKEVPWICGLGKTACERPLLFEGGRLIPFGQNLAVRKPWFTQERLPKEFFFKDVPGLRNVVTYARTMEYLMIIAYLAPLVVLMGLLRLVLGFAFSRYY
jgi:hypothetical protein